MILNDSFKKLFLAIVIATMPLGCRAEVVAVNTKVESAKLPADANFKQTPFPSTPKPSERGQFQTVRLGKKEPPILVSRVVVDGKPIGYGIYSDPSLSAAGVVKYTGEGESGLHVIFTEPDKYGVSSPYGSMSLSFQDESQKATGARYIFHPASKSLPDLTIENFNLNGDLHGTQIVAMTDRTYSESGTTYWNTSRYATTRFENGKEVSPMTDGVGSFSIEGDYLMRMVGLGIKNEGCAIKWTNEAIGMTSGRGLAVVVQKFGGRMFYYDEKHQVAGDAVEFRKDLGVVIVGPCAPGSSTINHGYTWILNPEQSIAYGKLNMGTPEGEWIYYMPTCTVIGLTSDERGPMGEVQIVSRDGSTKTVDIGTEGLDAYLKK